jgi:drug/metabolite transporter (DMT)-like permease
MTWIVAAFLSAAILGAVVIVDSHLVSKRMPGLRAFLVPTGILHLVFGLTIIGIHPLPPGVGTTTLVVAFASGIMRSIGVVLMLRAMRSEEVSRIIPITHTFPIFVAILAVPLLHETLGYKEWLAICITVAGAVLISAQWDGRSSGGYLRKSFAALMVASFLMGAANTGSKYALDHGISFWNMYSINAFCFCAMFLLTSLRPGVLRELWNMERRNPTIALLVVNECVALSGIVLSFWAMELGKVSLVSTILGTRPAFVFLGAVALTRIFPSILEERLTRSVAVVKTLSIALIITGVTIINL